MSYNTDLQEINADLQAILDTINALPEAGGGGIDFPDTIVAGDTPVIMSSTYSVMCTSSSLKATGMTITVPKDGTYRFRWYMAKLTDSGLSGTYASRLYKNGVAQGSSQSVSGDWGYKSCYVDVACAAGDKVEIYGQCRNVNYPLAVGNLVACIDWDIDWNGSSGSGSGGAGYKTCSITINGMVSPGVAYTRIENGQPTFGTLATNGVVNDVLCGSVMTFMGVYMEASVTLGESFLHHTKILYLTPLEEGASATINLTAD